LLIPLCTLTIAAAAATTQGAGHGAGLTSLFSAEAIIALLTLTALEIVLGIDNIVFIAILAAKLPADKQAKARTVGLALAMGMRVLLLLSISWIMGLTRPLVQMPPIFGMEAGLSGRDLILLLGGLFLIGKSTWEIHDKLEGDDHVPGAGRAGVSFGGVIVQILLLDLVFSLDSVITAVGMVQTDPAHRWVGLTVMIVAVVIAVGVMLVSAGPIAKFVERHPTVKMLALSFLLLIGVMLVVEGLHGHIPKGYIYFAMAFSLGVELMNMRLRKVSKPVHLHQSYVRTDAPPQGTSA
jgi:predicted tellurium resistance membrane protein TerC